MKPIDGAYVRAANDTFAGISISEARSDELPIELAQLRTAIEAVGEAVRFDADPWDFRVAMLALAEKENL